MKILEYLKERLSEASTWRGIVALIAATGITLSPEQSATIVAAGLAVIGMIGALTSDKKIEQ